MKKFIYRQNFGLFWKNKLGKLLRISHLQLKIQERLVDKYQKRSNSSISFQKINLL